MKPEQRVENQDVSIFMLLKLFANNIWLILLCVFLCVSVEMLRYSMLPKAFMSSTVIQIGNYDKIATKYDTDTYGVDVTSIDSSPDYSSLVVSRIMSVDFLADVADKLNLDIDVKPLKLPVIGGWIYNYNTSHHADQLIKSKYFTSFLSKYALGGQLIKIKTFDVTGSYYNKVFVIKYLGAGKFELYDTKISHTNLLSICTVGTLCKMPELHSSILVSEIFAQSGQVFILTHERSRDVAARLKKSLVILPVDSLSTGKRGSNSDSTNSNLQLSLIGIDKAQDEQALQVIVNQLIIISQQEQKAAIERSMVFIESQLIYYQNQLSQTRENFKQYKIKNNISGSSLDKQYEINSNLVSALTTQINDTNIVLNNLKASYGDEYPAVKAAKAKIIDLTKQKEVAVKELSLLPASGSDVSSFTDNIANQDSIVNKWQTRLNQAQIAYNAISPNVTIIDNVGSELVNFKTKHTRFLIISVIIGVIIGFFIILISMIFTKNRDPFFIAKIFGVDTTVIINYSNILIKHDLISKAILKAFDKFILKVKFDNNGCSLIGVFALDYQIGVTTAVKAIVTSLLGNNFKVLMLSFDEIIVANYQSTKHDFLDVQVVNLETIANALEYNKNSLEYDFIVIDYGNISDSMSKVESFKFIDHNCMTVCPDSSTDNMIEIVDFLRKLNVSVNSVFYNYNKQKIIHDFYSKK